MPEVKVLEQLTKDIATQVKTKVYDDLDKRSLEVDIDAINGRIGFKQRQDDEYNYTPPLSGKNGTSVTDIYVDDSTGDLMAVISDIPISESMVSFGGDITVNTLDSSSTDIVLKPNVMTKLGKVSQLIITLEPGSNPNVCNEYMLQFETGASGTIVVFEDDINWVSEPVCEPNMIYQVSILNNIGVIVGVSSTGKSI